jgi:thiol:disulfide interchange protein DsbD
VLVSFSCTGPIIGFLLVQVVTSSIVGPVIGMLGFAIALALPFTLFALFPQWLNTVPKSGNWMNVVKVTLGFVEIAFALKFFSVADLAYGWGLLDREVFLSLWIVLAILGGLTSSAGFVSHTMKRSTTRWGMWSCTPRPPSPVFSWRSSRSPLPSI